MSGDPERPASPPRSVSRRRFLRTAGVTGVGLSAAGMGRADDVPESQPSATGRTLADRSNSQSDRVLWQFQTGDWVTASPTVVGGTVYIGTHGGYQYALDAETGSQEWRFEVGTPVKHAPAVLPAGQSPFEGPAVFCSDEATFYAIDGATAEPQWRKEVEFATSPVLTQQTVLFFGKYLQRLRVADGIREWRSDLLASVIYVDDDTTYRNHGAPTMVDGQIYIGMLRNGFTAVSPQTGQGEWSYITRTPIRSSPTVHDGRVIAGDVDGTLYAIDAAEEVWTFSPSDEEMSSSPTVAEGTVFVGSHDGTLYAVDVDTGEERWRFETGGSVYSSPTVADGTVFVGSQDGAVYALDAATGEERFRFDTGETVRSSPTVVDGVLFVGGWNGNVYALDAGVSGSSSGTRIDQGVLGHHHSHVDADEQSLDPVEEGPVQTPPSGTTGTTPSSGFSSAGGTGPGFGVGTALAGLGAGALWARRRLGGD